VATRVLGDWRLIAQTGLALALANARYWTSVAPIVRKELKRWELRAQVIEDPALRALALSKLRDEGFHAEAAAMLATLAPRAHRRSIVEAIVAVEVLFDYLDGLTERPSADPLGDGAQLFAALIDAVASGSPDAAETPEVPRGYDGYLESLSRAVAGAIGRLPAAAAVTEVAVRTAEQSAHAQIRMHATASLGDGQLREWATAESGGSGLDWREFAAGAASSVLILHALIAAAGDPRTTQLAASEIAAAYLPVCVLLTLLDGIVDHEHDTNAGAPDVTGYLGLYEDPSALPDVSGSAARQAARKTRELPHGAHHLMILVGVTAYYASAPGAGGELARPVVARMRRELAPLMSPTLAIMRGWRSARRIRSSGAKGEGES
jgi:tetraprenyl-beta-curcumene synthase